MGQSSEVIQLSLNVEKLAQFRSILKQMKQGYAVLNSGYRTVKDLSEGNFTLHRTFLDGLLRVSPSVLRYRKIVEIIDMQVRVVEQCKRGYSRLRASLLFNPQELHYISGIHDRLLRLSLGNLNELLLVLSEQTLEMGDGERLSHIDAIHRQMEEKLHFLDHFNTEASILHLQRKKEMNSNRSMGKIHGMEQ
ncbi:TerB family tellurite resistance protein [Sphingobacterium mizutaii]|nr:TerB family tellurite resistance protein [Sphingobacterium mizutaii]MBV2227584.1 TerB family tellurite resistance protein [Sphingobacterium mizutaii]